VVSRSELRAEEGFYAYSPAPPPALRLGGKLFVRLAPPPVLLAVGAARGRVGAAVCGGLGRNWYVPTVS